MSTVARKRAGHADDDASGLSEKKDKKKWNDLVQVVAKQASERCEVYSENVRYFRARRGLTYGAWRQRQQLKKQAAMKKKREQLTRGIMKLSGGATPATAKVVPTSIGYEM